MDVTLDLYNLFNSQTAYNFDPRTHTGGSASTLNPLFGVPQSYYDPRRAQVTLRFTF